MSYYAEIIPGIYTSASPTLLAEFDRLLTEEAEQYMLFGGEDPYNTTQTPTQSIPREDSNEASTGAEVG